MQSAFFHRPVGIDAFSYYVPSLYLPISDLAEARGIEPAKLERGLGLQAMSVPDASEDVITMAGEALIDLVERNDLLPRDIGRIYVGTESMVDGSKPIASYLLGILSAYYEQNGLDSQVLQRCDVVDMTFACIGAVDAMQNSLDWIRLNPERKAIVISTDWAKYDLDSSGEYTQGAGAVALLLSAHPRILEIGGHWGVSTQCEHDFYKPLRRRVRAEDVVSSNGVDASVLGREIYVEHKDTPVYDGQYSNLCYTQRIEEALVHFTQLEQGTERPVDRWSRMIFHLPYAYQARRMFAELYVKHLKSSGMWNAFLERNELKEQVDGLSVREIVKCVSKSPEYKQFVAEKIETGERASSLIGNMYTGSIFMSLISCLLAEIDQDLAGQRVGFFAYGSGCKSKVFEGTIVSGYRDGLRKLDLFDRLDNRIKIGFHQYEYLHRHKLLSNLDSTTRRVFQMSSGWMEGNRYARNYSVTKMD